MARDGIGSGASVWRTAAGVTAGTGAALGGLAAWNGARSRAAEQAHPPIGRFLNVAGVRLHYLERGEGRPVVMLHGIGAMIQDFTTSGVFGLAHDRYRVIAFDRPGHGYSERPNDRVWTAQEQALLFLQALGHLGVHDPIIVGHSFGALISLAMAQLAPGRIAGLVPLAGYLYPTGGLDQEAWRLPGLPVLGPLLSHTIWPPLTRLMGPLIQKRLFSPRRPSERFTTGFPIPLLLRPGQIEAAGDDIGRMQTAAAQLAPRYSKLTLPVVIVSGEADRLTLPRHHSLRLHRDLPQSVLYMVANAGHMVHHAEPEGVIAALDAAWRLHDAQADRTSRAASH